MIVMKMINVVQEVSAAFATTQSTAAIHILTQKGDSRRNKHPSNPSTSTNDKTRQGLWATRSNNNGNLCSKKEDLEWSQSNETPLPTHPKHADTWDCGAEVRLSRRNRK